MIEIIQGVETNNTIQYLACTAFLRSQVLKFSVVVDQKKMMELLRGKANPLSGFVILETNTGEIIAKDIFDLVHWVELKGLKLC